MKLTSRVVAALALDTSESERIVWDDDIPGFGLRLRAGGSRNWVYQYKIGTKHRRMTLGALSAVPLVKAREMVGELYAKVRLGQDPAAVKDVGRLRASETFEPIAGRFLTVKNKSLRPRSYVGMERHLLINAKPLHGLSVAGIQRRDIAELLSFLRTNHSDNVANQVRASLSGFFTWAMREGLTESNPVIATNRTEDVKRDRVLSIAELQKIWAALSKDDYGDIVRLLLLTGQRREEFAALRWGDVDFDRGIITLPPSRTKNKREHVVPMVDMAKNILKERNRISGRDLVFGIGNGGFSGWSKSKVRLDQCLSIAAWRLHDIRRTVATGMADIGIQPHVIEAVLNHISGHKAGVAGVYNRATYLPEKTDALTKWAEHLLAVVERHNH